MRILTVLILGLLIVCVIDGNVIQDEALTASLQDVWNEDKFIIALSNITDKKKSGTSNSIETLLVINYKWMKIKLVLNRLTKRVILEKLDKNCQRSVTFAQIDSLAVDTPLKSLIILVHQSGAPMRKNSCINVYVDCIYKGYIPLEETFRDITETKDNPVIKVFRERRYQAKVYRSDIYDALKKEECSDQLIFLSFITQSLIFGHTELNHTGITHFTDSNGCDQEKKPTDQPDGTDDDDKINIGSSTLNPNYDSTSSIGQNDTKHHSNNKKSLKTTQTPFE